MKFTLKFGIIETNIINMIRVIKVRRKPVPNIVHLYPFVAWLLRIIDSPGLIPLSKRINRDKDHPNDIIIPGIIRKRDAGIIDIHISPFKVKYSPI